MHCVGFRQTYCTVSKRGFFKMNNSAFISNIMMTRDNSCCFTGHRSIPRDHIDPLRRVVEDSISYLYQKGHRNFICGGALGFDTLAAQTVLRATEHNREIKLILALPCRNQTERWVSTPYFDAAAAIREYQRIRGLADYVVYVNDFATPDCMKQRNQYMVDHSSACIAYRDPVVWKSGTAQTVRMAEKSGLEIINTFTILRGK